MLALNTSQGSCSGIFVDNNKSLDATANQSKILQLVRSAMQQNLNEFAKQLPWYLALDNRNNIENLGYKKIEKNKHYGDRLYSRNGYTAVKT